MATILKRKKKYSVVYDYYDEDGDRHQKWESFNSSSEAKKRKAEIEHKKANNTFVCPTVKTVSDLLHDFTELYGVNNWALSTYESKKGLIENYINPYIGKVKLSDITPKSMDEFYKKLLKVERVPNVMTGKHTGVKVSARNVLEIHKVLNCAFNQAVRWELIEHNPAAKASLPKYEKKTRQIWTMDVLSHAIDVCDDERLSLAINMAFSCSLRLGELMGLTWDCVTIDEESIKNNDASIYIEKELTRVAKDALQKLENKDVIKEFPAVTGGVKTALVLKKPKTKTSIRRIWLPETLARMLVEWKQKQEDYR